MRRSFCCFAVLLVCLLWVRVVGEAQPPQEVVLEDFEMGLSKWTVNDSRRAAGGSGVVLVEAVVVRLGAPQAPGRSCALFAFRSAENAWATVSTSLPGRKLKSSGCLGIAFWLKGDGSNSKVDLVLRARAPDRSIRRFSYELGLEASEWTKVKVPFEDFKDAAGRSADELIESLFSLQLSKQGSWHSFFLFIDHLTAYVQEPEPMPMPHTTPEAEEKPGKPHLPPEEVRVTADFQKVVGKTKLRVGTNLDTEALRLLDDEELLNKAKSLRLGMARIKTSYASVFSEDTQETEFSYETLDSLIKLSKTLGAAPLLCLAPRSEAEMQSEEFEKLCRVLAIRYNQPPLLVRYFELFDRPTSFPVSAPIESVIARFKMLQSVIEQAAPHSIVGGYAEASALQLNLQRFIKDVQSLGFLSFSFYGTHNASTKDQLLLQAALKGISADLPEQLSPADVRRLLDRTGKTAVKIFASECSLNSIKSSEGEAQDGRLRSPYAAAWFAVLFTKVAQTVDELFQFKLANSGWGLFDENNALTPSYWAVWFYNTYFPRASQICRASAASESVAVFAAKTQTAYNLMAVNLSGEKKVLHVEIAMPGELKMVRWRQMNADPLFPPTYAELNLKTYQRLTLAPWSVGVLQFIPVSTK